MCYLLYVAGLNAMELGCLNSSVLPFIRQSAVSLIHPECLAVSLISSLLSSEQLIIATVESFNLNIYYTSASSYH